MFTLFPSCLRFCRVDENGFNQIRDGGWRQVTGFLPKRGDSVPNACPGGVDGGLQVYGGFLEFVNPTLELAMTALFRISLFLMLAGMGMGDIVVASVGLVGLCGGAVVLSVRQDEGEGREVVESEFIA
ncbi:hypothetical protein [Pseudomonas mosselii]|uniref:hypothetical protein n=1 Tax=Pseudomonas mosselii TaxID=78327 RepID=UPI00117BC9D9|nr:hypothetical protein [Pseudomonas mosselii]